MTKLVSALSPLTPHTVWDTQTGEEILDWATPVTSLLNHVQTETTRLFTQNKPTLLALLETKPKISSPNSYARQNNITSNYKTLPDKIKAKSRINELVLHKLVSETSAFVNNPTPTKQEPTFINKISLGAADKQMSSISLEHDQLTLVWKCWDKELLLAFTVPGYVMKRNILKWALPNVQVSRKTGLPVFYFTIFEQPLTREPGTHNAGLDLGRVEPYTMAITNQNGERVAHYTSSGRLNQLNHKRERLLVERKHILIKLDHYKKLGYSPEQQAVLQAEASLKRNKITRLGIAIAHEVGSEVTKKLDKHKVNTLNLENLKWVTGVKYGSKWNHSKQQEHITHSLSRVGIKTKLVNPKNTSQECYKCGTKLVHNTKTRTVWCVECKTRLDRDLNASLSISKNKKPYPASHSKNRDNCSSKGQVVVQKTFEHESIPRSRKLTFPT